MADFFETGDRRLLALPKSPARVPRQHIPISLVRDACLTAYALLDEHLCLPEGVSVHPHPAKAILDWWNREGPSPGAAFFDIFFRSKPERLPTQGDAPLVWDILAPNLRGATSWYWWSGPGYLSGDPIDPELWSGILVDPAAEAEVTPNCALVFYRGPRGEGDAVTVTGRWAGGGFPTDQAEANAMMIEHLGRVPKMSMFGNAWAAINS